jgi:putative hydrolase of the HAD superfamily
VSGNAYLAVSFDVVTISSIAGVEKPAPEIFEQTLIGLQVTADRVLHVGDSPLEDYAGAEHAGLAAALIDRGGLFAGQPYRRITSLTEVPELLL